MYYPHNIFMFQDLAYDKHCKFIFGSYVESHEYCKIIKKDGGTNSQWYLPGDHCKISGEL